MGGYRRSEFGSADGLEVESCQTWEDAEEPALSEGELPLVRGRVRVARGADVEYEAVDVAVEEDSAPEFALAGHFAEDYGLGHVCGRGWRWWRW